MNSDSIKIDPICHRPMKDADVADTARRNALLQAELAKINASETEIEYDCKHHNAPEVPCPAANS
jgi:hypothetical protein